MVRLRVVEANKESNKIIIIIVTIHTTVCLLLIQLYYVYNNIIHLRYLLELPSFSLLL